MNDSLFLAVREKQLGCCKVLVEQTQFTMVLDSEAMVSCSLLMLQSGHQCGWSTQLRCNDLAETLESDAAAHRLQSRLRRHRSVPAKKGC